MINGRYYGEHALDQMQNRGITPMLVEETITQGIRSENHVLGRMQFYDPKNNLFVVTEGEDIVTVMFRNEAPN